MTVTINGKEVDNEAFSKAREHYEITLNHTRYYISPEQGFMELRGLYGDAKAALLLKRRGQGMYRRVYGYSDRDNHSGFIEI